MDWFCKVSRIKLDEFVRRFVLTEHSLMSHQPHWFDRPWWGTRDAPSLVCPLAQVTSHYSKTCLIHLVWSIEDSWILTYLRSDMRPWQLRSLAQVSRNRYAWLQIIFEMAAKLISWRVRTHFTEESVLILMIRSAMPLTSPRQTFVSSSSSRISATILAPWIGGLENIARTRIFSWDSTRIISSEDWQTREKAPTRSP